MAFLEEKKNHFRLIFLELPIYKLKKTFSGFNFSSESAHSQQSENNIKLALNFMNKHDVCIESQCHHHGELVNRI